MRTLLAALLLTLPLLAWAASPPDVPAASKGDAAGSNTASKPAAPGRSIDQPIPETYQPLTGPRWSNTFSREIKAARTLDRQQDNQPTPQQQPPAEPAAHFNIHAPEPPAPPPPKAPVIEEHGNTLNIHD